MIRIDLPTARRFILGRQGLWPGRRWRGLEGADAAIRAMEYLQLDPLQIIARSQDIALSSRVLDYRPEGWETLAYEQRRFFDWGGWLALRPMEELPHWRSIMRREPDRETRLHTIARDHADAVAEVRATLQERGTVSNRDFDGKQRPRTMSYRGRKDTSLALYYLWMIGEVMTHHRERFERVYALTEAVAPAHLITESSEDEAARFVIRKEIGFYGLARISRSAESYRRGEPDRAARTLLQGMVDDGEIVEVQVDGWKHTQHALASDLPLLEALSAGRIPAAWAPLESTTSEEVVFLAPLEAASARGRASALFGFDYVWEVYKPVEKRSYGYYTLPVLWADQLVARFDSRFDRKSSTLILLGLWLEDDSLGTDAAFSEALARGFARFLRFLGAETLDTSAITQTSLRRRLAEFLR